MKPVSPGSELPPSLRLALPAGAESRAWRVGQVLTALVRSSGPDSAILRINGQNIEAATTRPLPQGQVLQLEVAALSPRVTLRPATPDAGQALLNAAQRVLLPRQAPLDNLVQTLVRAGDQDRLPPAVRDAVNALLRAIPASGELSQESRIRDLFRNSGLLFEQKLQQIVRQQASPDQLAGDQKGLLANLLRQLFGALQERPRSTEGGRHTPPGAAQPAQSANVRAPLPLPRDVNTLLGLLARQTDGALARVQLSQVNLLAGEIQLPWLVEIPVRDGDRTDALRLLLDREPQQGENDAERGWTVRLSLDNADLGGLHCTVTLRGRTVSTNWWAERRDTATRVDTQLQLLATRLEALDLTVGGMRCVHGRPPEPPRPASTSGALFNERA